MIIQLLGRVCAKRLGQDKRYKIVAEVGDGEEAIDAIKQHKPKIAILDVDMPGKNGFDVARWIQKNDVSTEIIFLTMHKDEDLFNEAIDLGARGFVLKDSALTDMIECLSAVVRSGHFASHPLTTFLINRTKRTIQMSEKTPSLNSLTPSERKVLKAIADKLTSKEIADELSISYRTVEKHRSNIAKKLNLKGSNSLLKFAISSRSKLL